MKNLTPYTEEQISHLEDLHRSVGEETAFYIALKFLEDRFGKMDSATIDFRVMINKRINEARLEIAKSSEKCNITETLWKRFDEIEKESKPFNK